MKFGVSYNVFEDSVELLESSINSIKESVDYINIIYQTISNFGEKSTPSFDIYIKYLKERKIVNDIFLYTPIIGAGHINELNKRNIGLSFARGNKVDYFMSMDSDEFYIKKQLEFVKTKIINNNNDSSFCKMRTYYKYPTHQITPPEEYYVPLFYNIKNDKNFLFNDNTPVMVDPTRRINSNNPLILDRSEIEMHHMSYVRKNIKSKIDNSSAKVNFGDLHNKFISYYDNWKENDKALLAGMGETYYDIIKVDNIFDISL